MLPEKPSFKWNIKQEYPKVKLQLYAKHTKHNFIAQQVVKWSSPKQPNKGKCQVKGIVYQATVTNEDNNEQETYVGLTEGTFKTRYLNHTSSFRNEKRKRATELSKHIWSLKQSNTRHSIRWKIIKKCQPYSNRTKRCNLSLYEKIVFICGFHGNNTLCTMEHACCLHCPTCAKLQHFLSIICGDIPHFIDFI